MFYRSLLTLPVILTVACGGSPPPQEVAATGLSVHELSMAPSCFVEPQYDSSEGDLMRATREMILMNGNWAQVLPWLSALIDQMLLEPNAEGWWVVYEDGRGGILEAIAYPTGDGDVIDTFEIEVTNDYGTYILSGKSTASTTSLAYSNGETLRWSDYAFRGFGLWRGCDPETGYSFEGIGGWAMECWDSDGSEIACSGVDTWPM